MVLIFSFISEFAGLLLIWLIWTHREKTSCKPHICDMKVPVLHRFPLTFVCPKDVAWIAYFTWIATTTSIIQQIHLYTYGFFHSIKHHIDSQLPMYRRWEDVMTTQFHHTVATAPSAELIVSSSTTGMDLVLFYIRRYSHPGCSLNRN